MDLSKGNSFTPTVMGCPGVVMYWYISTSSAGIMTMANLAGGGGQSILLLYHPLIWIHASQMRGGLDVSSDSTADPASASL